VELQEWHRWWRLRGARELRALLMDGWDPIGVSSTPEAYDEYYAYIGPLARRLRSGADASAVAEYLADVQTEQMGLPMRPDELGDIADSVVRWFAAEMARGD
jgi:hypothetical protein